MTPAVSSEPFIPTGPYCYQLLEVVSRPGQFTIFKTKFCSHFEKSAETNRCNLLKVEDDFLLDESCKICAINLDGSV